MSGRTGVTQHYRTTTPNNPPAPNTLLDGEISIEQADPMRLWIGVPTTMVASGQKLLYDASTAGNYVDLTTDQTIAGLKTFTDDVTIAAGKQLVAERVSWPSRLGIEAGAAGARGDLDITANEGGDIAISSTINPTANGGDVRLVAGESSASSGGAIRLFGGVGATSGGSVFFTGGVGTTLSGGSINLDAGAGAGGGGSIRLTTGAATVDGVSSGSFNIVTPNSRGGSIAGDIKITAGGAGAVLNGVAADIQLVAGAPGTGANAAAPGGSVTISSPVMLKQTTGRENLINAVNASELMRWRLVMMNLSPEDGNNRGSDFSISRFADNGDPIDSVMQIIRQTGIVDFKFPPTVAGAPLVGDFLPLTGGTLTGPLTVSAGFTVNPTAFISHTITGGPGPAGGAVLISGGEGTTNLGGQLVLRAGLGATIGGPISVIGGNATTGPGGAVTLNGGDGVIGGNLVLIPGAGTTRGGYVQLRNLPTVATGDPESVWNNGGVLNIGAGGSSAVVHDASLTGTGVTATPLAVAQSTQLQLGGARIATTLEINAGTLDATIMTPLGLRSVTGDKALLLTTDKTALVPAMNEMFSRIEQLVGVVIFAGNYDATARLATFNGQGGITAGTTALPAASAANHGAYVITTVAGAGGGPNEPAGAIGIGDWLLSDGAAWIKMPFSQAPLTAANIGVVPPVNGGASNVQAALEAGIYFMDPATFTGDGKTAATPVVISQIDAGAY